MIEEIENKKLLTPFYLEILKGVHDVGKEMNLFEISWKKQIQKIKKELEEKFENQEKIMNYLRENNLLDKGHYGLEADRCYSVLVSKEGKYLRKSYFEAFEEVEKIILELKKFKEKLLNLEDKIYHKKKNTLIILNL